MKLRACPLIWNSLRFMVLGVLRSRKLQENNDCVWERVRERWRSALWNFNNVNSAAVIFLRNPRKAILFQSLFRFFLFSSSVTVMNNVAVAHAWNRTVAFSLYLNRFVFCSIWLLSSCSHHSTEKHMKHAIPKRLQFWVYISCDVGWENKGKMSCQTDCRTLCKVHYSVSVGVQQIVASISFVFLFSLSLLLPICICLVFYRFTFESDLVSVHGAETSTKYIAAFAE